MASPANPDDDRPTAARTARAGGRSFAQSSLSFLGSGIQRLDLSLDDLGTRYSQARESIQQLDIGTRIESGRQVIGTEMKARNLDGRRLQSSLEVIGGASQRLGSAVGGATDRIRDSVHSIEGRDAKEKIGTVVGEVRNRVDATLQDRLGSDAAQQEDLAALRRRLRDDHEEMEATNMMEEAEAACKEVIQTHLDDFIGKNPSGSYEQWLRELHPDNDYEGQLLEGFTELDHRFYVKESDHLRMWNDHLGGIRQMAKPRYRIGGHEQDTQVVDLLGSSSPVNDSSRATISDVGGRSSSDVDVDADSLLDLGSQPEMAKESKPAHADHTDLLGVASHPSANAESGEEEVAGYGYTDVDLLG